jgi:hypothetical protein
MEKGYQIFLNQPDRKDFEYQIQGNEVQENFEYDTLFCTLNEFALFKPNSDKPFTSDLIQLDP